MSHLVPVDTPSSPFPQYRDPSQCNDLRRGDDSYFNFMIGEAAVLIVSVLASTPADSDTFATLMLALFCICIAVLAHHHPSSSPLNGSRVCDLTGTTRGESSSQASENGEVGSSVNTDETALVTGSLSPALPVDLEIQSPGRQLLSLMRDSLLEKVATAANLPATSHNSYPDYHYELSLADIDLD